MMASLQQFQLQKCSLGRRTVAITASHVHRNASFAPMTTKQTSGSKRMSTIVKIAAGGALSTNELPAGFHMYETLVVLRPDMVDDERDQVLAKFEAFLRREECTDINTTIKGRQKLAYPIKKFAEGIYVLYTFAAPPPVSQRIQKLLSTPESGAELNILRHMTFRI